MPSSDHSSSVMVTSASWLHAQPGSDVLTGTRGPNWPVGGACRFADLAGADLSSLNPARVASMSDAISGQPERKESRGDHTGPAEPVAEPGVDGRGRGQWDAGIDGRA